MLLRKIVSPVINGDGTATFNVPYNGDKLYLVGDINGWDNKGIEMKKVAEDCSLTLWQLHQVGTCINFTYIW